MWPDINSEWPQYKLHAWVRQMGISCDPSEVIPQGVKYIEWPQPPPTEHEIAFARELLAEMAKRKIKPLAVIGRIYDPRRN